jgi:mannose-6-phosphate isomerase-like protein (cupin superfamily)
MTTANQDINQRTNRSTPRLERQINTYDDFATLRQDWLRSSSTPLLLRSEAGRLVKFPGADIRVLSDGDLTAGAVSIFEQTIHPGFVAGNHHQANEDELFFILDGEMKLTIGSQTVVATPGSFGYAPRWCTHHFEPAGDRPSRMLTWNAPAGHERIFESFSRLVQQGRHLHGPTRKAAVEAHDTNFHDLLQYADDPSSYVPTEERPGPRGRAVDARTNRCPGDPEIARHTDERGPLTYPVLTHIDQITVGQPAGQRTAVLLDAKRSASTWSVVFHDLPVGYSQAPTVQGLGWQSIHVVSGTVVMTVGNTTEKAPAGAFGFVPQGVNFGMSVEGDQHASVIIVNCFTTELP